MSVCSKTIILIHFVKMMGSVFHVSLRIKTNDLFPRDFTFKHIISISYFTFLTINHVFFFIIILYTVIFYCNFPFCVYIIFPNPLKPSLHYTITNKYTLQHYYNDWWGFFKKKQQLFKGDQEDGGWSINIIIPYMEIST